MTSLYYSLVRHQIVQRLGDAGMMQAGSLSPARACRVAGSSPSGSKLTHHHVLPVFTEKLWSWLALSAQPLSSHLKRSGVTGCRPRSRWMQPSTTTLRQAAPSKPLRQPLQTGSVLRLLALWSFWSLQRQPHTTGGLHSSMKTPTTGVVQDHCGVECVLATLPMGTCVNCCFLPSPWQKEPAASPNESRGQQCVQIYLYRALHLLQRTWYQYRLAITLVQLDTLNLTVAVTHCREDAERYLLAAAAPMEAVDMWMRAGQSLSSPTAMTACLTDAS